MRDGDRGDIVALREHPGQSDLCRCGADLGGTTSTSLTMRRFFSKSPWVKRGLVLRPVGVVGLPVQRIFPVRKAVAEPE